jgi:hypothetical protein
MVTSQANKINVKLGGGELDYCGECLCWCCCGAFIIDLFVFW